MSFRAGFIALIGRPNAGKSTLLNHILNHKVAIVSNKAQTTRNMIRGIKTTNDFQMIFIDTPGIHKPQHELGRQLNRLAFSALEGVDVIYYLLDATKPFGKGDQFVLDLCLKQNLPILLILNKIDLITKKQLMELLLQYSSMEIFKEVIPVSAKNNDNIDRLLEVTQSFIPEQEAFFSDDTMVDFPEYFYITEIIREHILHLTNQEVPHSVAVTLDNFKEDKKAILIQASIIADRDSQKGILIGKQGSMLKEIGQNARIELEKRFNKPVYLDLVVKVDKNWRNVQKRLNAYNNWDLDE
ncbi:MAG: GTPase Era [Erysipelotrichaceae bacterium]